MGSPRRWLSHTPWPDVQAFERRCKAAREREAAAKPRTGPWILGALEEAQGLARRAERLHREADEIAVPLILVRDREGREHLVPDTASPEAQRRASLRRVALDLDQEADRLVPVEHRP